MNRYRKGKIYALRSDNTDQFYIGSTCCTLPQRLYKHRMHLKEYKNGTRKSKTTSFEILEHDDCYIELLEDCPCDTKAQLLKREGELIREHRPFTVNKHIAGAKINNPNYSRENALRYRKENPEKVNETNRRYRENNTEKIAATKKLWRQKNRDRLLAQKKQYREDNKEDILQKAAEYRKKNQEKIAAWKKLKVQCECGTEVLKANFARHKKSKKHQSWEKL